MIRDKDVHVMTKKMFNEKLIMCYDFPNHCFSEGDIEWLVMFGDLFFRNRAKGECWRLCVTVDRSEIDGLND